jgi:putative membrane protein
MTNRTRWWLAVPMLSGLALGTACQNQDRSASSAPGAAPRANTGTDNPNTTNLQTTTVKSDDASKLNMIWSALHNANQQEISEGKIAADRAQSAEVKKFANDMVTEHTSADEKLLDVGKRMDIDATWSPRDNPVHQAKEEAKDQRKKTLSSLSGAAFDIAYIAPEADEHESVVQIIDQGQKVATGDAKRLLDELKPTVEAHREHARRLLNGFRLETTAMGGGPMGGATTNDRDLAADRDRASGSYGRNVDRDTAKHDGGAGWKTGLPRTGKGAGSGADTTGNTGSGTSGTRGGGTSAPQGNQ